MISWVNSLLISGDLYEKVFLTAGLILGVSVFSTAVATLLILSIPADYLLHLKTPALLSVRPFIYWPKVILKNVLGLLLLAAGIVMLVTPGQGLITMLFGIILIDFPGKDIIVNKILTQPKILTNINRIRARFKKPPLIVSS